MDAPTTRGTTHKWAKHFNEKFPELAKVSPVFSELQNLIDLAVLAALLKKEQLSHQVGWTMSLFLDEQRATLAKWNVPRQVKTVANSKVTNGSRVIGNHRMPGVTIDPLRRAAAIAALSRGYRRETQGRSRVGRSPGKARGTFLVVGLIGAIDANCTAPANRSSARDHSLSGGHGLLSVAATDRRRSRFAARLLLDLGYVSQPRMLLCAEHGDCADRKRSVCEAGVPGVPPWFRCRGKLVSCSAERQQHPGSQGAGADSEHVAQAAGGGGLSRSDRPRLFDRK